jgi:iron complex outermembrane recepter protein
MTADSRVAKAAGRSVICALVLATVPLRTADAAPQTVQELKKLSYDDLLNIEVTTVSRTDSTVGQSAAAVSVITQQDIRRSGATTIPELLRLVPGMNVARIDNNKWAVSARGFNQRFFGKMLVQIDGRTLYNPFTSGVYWDAVDYPLEDIDRIEVIRGPRAGVWGANAVNGIVNIITKPGKDTQGGLLVSGGGLQEKGFGMFRYGGHRGSKLSYRLYGKGFNRGEQSSGSGDSHDAWSGESSGFRMDWQPSDMNLVTLQGDYLHSVAERRDVRAQPIPPYSFDNADTERTHNVNVLGRWRRTINDDSSWTLQVYWDTFHRFSDSLETPFRWDTYDVDFQHQFSAGQRHKLLWGTGYRLVNSLLGHSERDNGFLFHTVQERHADQTVSVYVQDEVTLVEGALTLSLNSRFEHNDFTGSESQPGAQLLFTPTKQHTFWASVARAVRIPNLNEFYAEPRLLPSATVPPVFPRQVANPGIRPETVLAYQLGYRAQAATTLSLDTALFYNVYDDLVTVRSGVPQPGPSGFDLPLAQINGLNADTNGMELSATWRLLDSWRLNGGYTLLKMNIHRDVGLGLPPSSEAAERQSPQHQVNLRSYFDLPRNVELDLIGRWVERLSGFNPNGVPGVADAIPSYVALDAQMAWHARKNLEIAVVGQNLLDDHHPEFGTSPLVRSPLVELRRGVFTKVTWRFD